MNTQELLKLTESKLTRLYASRRDAKPDVLELQTEELDRHNDFIVFYLLAEDGQVVLTDLGWTISELIAETANERSQLIVAISSLVEAAKAETRNEEIVLPVTEALTEEDIKDYAELLCKAANI